MENHEQMLQEVNNPKHYQTHESGIEAIEITRYLIGDLSNAWKYGMRYEDKNVPKKDLYKLSWYLTDFRENQTMNVGISTVQIPNVPDEVMVKMQRVIEFEPVEEVKEIFKEILSIVETKAIVDISNFENCIVNIKKYADTFSN